MSDAPEGRTSGAAPPEGERQARRGRTSTRTKRLLVVIAAIALAPVILSYLAYRFSPREARVNYGVLLAPRTLAPIVGSHLDGKPFASGELRGRWIVLYASPGDCPGDCAAALYASRQARTIQNAERERVARVWLVTGDAVPAAALLGEHADLTVVRVRGQPVAQLPQGTDRIYVVDPLGNFVLAWPSNPDIKAMAKDLARLLRASAIG